MPAVLVIAVGLDRWLLGANFLTDIVGGALLGAFVATASLIAAGVKVPGQELMTEIVRSKIVSTLSAPARRAAVIFNPTKVTDWAMFRRRVDYELTARGWQRTLWMETTTDDPGRAMAEQAVREGVDLVLGAGGDGTIRVICAGLAGTGVPFGLIPAGTGNLLARNIGIPLDEAAALDVAFDGMDKPIDLVRLTVDDGTPDYFAVMAGVGIDAVIMEGTDPNLKRAVGSAAYFVSAAQHANHPALHATITVDDQPEIKRRAHVIVIGNVGILQANIQLIPGARADDGILDVLVASPRTARDWVRLTTQVLTRRRREDDQLDRLTGRKVTIKVEERDQYQVDGDTVGECNTMIAEVLPGALTSGCRGSSRGAGSALWVLARSPTGRRRPGQRSERDARQAPSRLSPTPQIATITSHCAQYVAVIGPPSRCCADENGARKACAGSSGGTVPKSSHAPRGSTMVSVQARTVRRTSRPKPVPTSCARDWTRPLPRTTDALCVQRPPGAAEGRTRVTEADVATPSRA